MGKDLSPADLRVGRRSYRLSSIARCADHVVACRFPKIKVNLAKNNNVLDRNIERLSPIYISLCETTRFGQEVPLF